MTSYVAVPQGRWKNLPLERRLLKVPQRMARLDRIQELLEHADGVAVLARVDLPVEMMKPGVRDGTIDVPDMSRSNNAWGMAISYGLARLFPWLHYNRLAAQTLDLYYDNWDLGRGHKAKLEELVIEALPKVIRQACLFTQTIPSDRPRIRRFQSVSKTPRSEQSDSLQSGILVAHYLLQFWRHFEGVMRIGRISAWDNTEIVVEHIRKFEVI